jgi:hypothetical protein
MKYEKPECALLASAFSVIRDDSKQGTSTDAVCHGSGTGKSACAYQADE